MRSCMGLHKLYWCSAYPVWILRSYVSDCYEEDDTGNRLQLPEVNNDPKDQVHENANDAKGVENPEEETIMLQNYN